MESSGKYVLNEMSAGMIEALTSCTNDVTWAADMINIYKSLKSVYVACGNINEAPGSVRNLGDAMKKLENYLLIDLARHIATQNGRRPYYFGNIQERLRESLSALEGFLPANDAAGEHAHDKKFDHLTADLNAAFVEYGFCRCTEILYEVDEIMRRLDQLAYRVEFIEEVIAGNNENHETLIIADLHDVIASQHGIQQAITEEDFKKVSPFYDELTERVGQLFKSIMINKDARLFRKYVMSQHNLKQDFLSSLCTSDAANIITDHMIHPGTRIWILERISRWYLKSTHRIFYFSGWKGSGMSAMASTICKLYGSDVIACHFFNARDGNSKMNTITGLLESLASDMCKTLPRYSKYMHDKYGSALKSHLNNSWKDTYTTLFQIPLKSIFGTGQRTPVRRKLLIIDGLDECTQSEWKDIKEFLSRFAIDFTARFCIFVTVEMNALQKVVDINNEACLQGIKLDEKPWVYQHIKDLEIYVASSLGAILSGEDEADTPFRARIDSATLQNAVDNLCRLSAGRFDFAMELMAAFAKEMQTSSGQFLSSLKKSNAAVLNAHGSYLEDLSVGFSKFFSSYRYSEGRPVEVRVMRQSSFPLDKTRAALIRAHHKMV